MSTHPMAKARGLDLYYPASRGSDPIGWLTATLIRVSPQLVPSLSGECTKHLAACSHRPKLFLPGGVSLGV